MPASVLSSVFRQSFQFFQFDKTRATLLFILIIFVLLFITKVLILRVRSRKGFPFPLVTANIKQLFSYRVLRRKAILDIRPRTVPDFELRVLVGLVDVLVKLHQNLLRDDVKVPLTRAAYTCLEPTLLNPMNYLALANAEYHGQSLNGEQIAPHIPRA
jgi:hypothetical protein